MKKTVMGKTALVAALAASLLVTACGKDRKEVLRERTLASETITSIGINAYLWRATLDTLDFMPMAQVDSNGGVIITDWYANPSDPTERAKVTVYIVDKALRADAIKVNVFKQALRAGEWVDVAAGVGAEKDIEDAILIEARQLRLTQVSHRN